MLKKPSQIFCMKKTFEQATKPRRKIGIGPEGKMHKDFAGLLRQYEGYKKLNCVFWSYNASGERRTLMTGALLKAKGLAKGIPDFFFIKNNNGVAEFIWIEFKAGKGKQSDEQKKFEDSVSGFNNMRYYIVYSVADAIRILENEGIIIK